MKTVSLLKTSMILIQVFKVPDLELLACLLTTPEQLMAPHHLLETFPHFLTDDLERVQCVKAACLN